MENKNKYDLDRDGVLDGELQLAMEERSSQHMGSDEQPVCNASAHIQTHSATQRLRLRWTRANTQTTKCTPTSKTNYFHFVLFTIKKIIKLLTEIITIMVNVNKGFAAKGIAGTSGMTC